MRKYQGKLVFQRRSETGVVEVVDDHLTRSLHFGNSTRQSTMYLYHPAVLALTYTQTMMACLLFNPSPRRVLLLGLGGGSLAKFVLHHFPACQIDAVESDPNVVSVARSHFGLPEEPGLHVHITDAVTFTTDAVDEFSDYDLVLADVFDAGGIVSSVTETEFLETLEERLSTDGVLAVNLSRGERTLYRQALRNLRTCFPRRLFRLPVIDKGNEIAFALHPQMGLETSRSLRRRAQDLQDRLGLDFLDYLARMRQYNPSMLERLFG